MPSNTSNKAYMVHIRQTSRFLQATKTLREYRGIALLYFQTLALEGGEGSASRPGRFLSRGKTRYPLQRRLGGPQGRSGQVRKISPTTEIRSPDSPARSQSLYRLSYRAISLAHIDVSCMYSTSNLTGRRVPVTIVAMEKEQVSHILSVCLWSQLSRVQCACAVLYCHKVTDVSKRRYDSIFGVKQRTKNN